MFYKEPLNQNLIFSSLKHKKICFIHPSNVDGDICFHLRRMTLLANVVNAATLCVDHNM